MNTYGPNYLLADKTNDPGGKVNNDSNNSQK